jgi:UDPglucose 6-dehydrogenase
MKISVIGTGYVGLVSGACLADMGNHVLCLDIDPGKIERLKQGIIPIYEPGLEAMVKANVAAGRLRFTTSYDESVEFARLQMIAVGTPPGEDGSADLTHVLAAARSIAERMQAPKVIIDKSTVPVGTADRVRDCIALALRERGADLAFHVVSNPEFLKEGAAVEDFMRPDRIVIGCDDRAIEDELRELYAPFQRNHDKLVFMDVRSAELTKYAANAMLATRISFMNEMALLAEKVGADIEHVRKGIGSDPRIGYHFLYAGVGYGGSCFPKDVKAILKSAYDVGLNLQVIDAVERANEHQKGVMLAKIEAVYGADLSGRCFALWGLAFKPNTDDMREAPSRVLIDGLLARGATIQAFDPVAMPEAKHLYASESRLRFVGDPAAAWEHADGLVIVTEWKIFRSPDFTAMRAALKQPTRVFDGRNLYDPAAMARLGIEYYGIGRPFHPVL